MIDAFKSYYVDALDYVLVFDLPVVLNGSLTLRTVRFQKLLQVAGQITFFIEN